MKTKTTPEPQGQSTALRCGALVRLLAALDEETKARMTPEDHADRALWHLLKRWQKELPDLDERFHKSFRQCDITSDGETDMAIWNLLGGSRRFWRLFEAAQDDSKPNVKVTDADRRSVE